MGLKSQTPPPPSSEIDRESSRNFSSEGYYPPSNSVPNGQYFPGYAGPSAGVPSNGQDKRSPNGAYDPSNYGQSFIRPDGRMYSATPYGRNTQDLPPGNDLHNGRSIIGPDGRLYVPAYSGPTYGQPFQGGMGSPPVQGSAYGQPTDTSQFPER
jgi:hypothetical protein